MKSAVVVLICLSVAMINGMAMNYDGSEEEEMFNPLDMLFKMPMGSMRRPIKCPDPIPIFTEIFSLMCDAKDCAINAPKCIHAMVPPGNMCEYAKQCMRDLRPYKNKGEGYGDMKSKMMECMCEKIMADMKLDYVKGDMKGNTLKIIESTMKMSQDLTDTAKTDVMNAIVEDKCVVPTEDFKIMDKVKFDICVVKTCVKAMAEP